MSSSLEVMVMKEGLIKKKESVRLELEKLIKERNEFNETTNDVELLKKHIWFREEVEKNLKERAINPDNQVLLIEYQQLLKEAYETNFFNEATIYNDKQTLSSIPQEGVTNVITKHPSHMNCKFKEVSEEYQFNISALENSTILIELQNKLFGLEQHNLKIGRLEHEIDILDMQIKELHTIRDPLISNDAENTLNLPSQAQILANANELGIPLHIPKPAGKNEGISDYNTPQSDETEDGAIRKPRGAVGSLIFSCPLVGVRTTESQHVMIGYNRGNLWRHGRPQYAMQIRTITTYPDGRVVAGDWH